MNSPSIRNLIERLYKDFGGDATLQQMMFVTYKGKLNCKKEREIMQAFPEYNFYFICKGKNG